MTAENYEEEIVEEDVTDGDGENMSPTARRVMRAESRNYDNCPGDFLCRSGWEQELLRRLIEMYQGINYLELSPSRRQMAGLHQHVIHEETEHRHSNQFIFHCHQNRN